MKGTQMSDHTIDDPRTLLVQRATLFKPGSFFPEESTKDLDDRTLEEVAREAGPDVFAVQSFWQMRTTAIVDGEQQVGYGPPFARSSRLYVGGTVYTVEELKAAFPDERVLIHNIEGNGYERAIYCRTGNWQPLEKEDRVLSSHPPPTGDAGDATREAGPLRRGR
jgi:hypothetical protein